MLLEKPPLIVLRSNDCCFLGILRSCANAGIPVIAVNYTWPGAGPWYSEQSVHEYGTRVIPNPFTQPEEAREAFLALLRVECARWKTPLMAVPSSDTSLMFLYDNFSSFSPYLRLIGAQDFNRPRFDIANKFFCATLLKEAGFNIPASYHCDAVADIPKILSEITYPCLYKPVVKDYGQQFYAHHGHAKAVRCNDKQALAVGLAQECHSGFPVIVQTLVEFDEPTDEVPVYLYVDREHHIRMACTGIKENIEPPPFGTATSLRLSWHSELLPLMQQLVTAIRWRGILMVECIRDKQGQWFIIELNPRPWLFVDFYRRAGFNFLAYLYADLYGELQGMPDFVCPTEAQQNAFLHMDLSAELASRFKQGQQTVTLPALRNYLATVPGVKSFCYFDPSDLEPGRQVLTKLNEKYQLDAAKLELLLEEQSAEFCY